MNPMMFKSFADTYAVEVYERAARNRDVRIARARARRIASQARPSERTRPSRLARLLALGAS